MSANGVVSGLRSLAVAAREFLRASRCKSRMLRNEDIDEKYKVLPLAVRKKQRWSLDQRENHMTLGRTWSCGIYGRAVEGLIVALSQAPANATWRG